MSGQVAGGRRYSRPYRSLRAFADSGMTADEWKRAHDQERQAAVEASRDSARRAMDRGALITSMREAMGWSYRELGRRLDVSPSSVRRWELDGAPLIAYHAVRDIVRGEP